jgi:hypothetical protein
MKQVLFTLSCLFAIGLMAQKPFESIPKATTVAEIPSEAISIQKIRVLRNPTAVGLPSNNANLEFLVNYLNNSNAVTAAFSNAFINPIFIDEALKETSYKRLEETNRFGLEFSYGAAVSFFPDSSWRSNRHALQISYKQDNFAAAAFTEDVFRLFFGGNAAYANKTATLSNSAFYNLLSRSLYLDYKKVKNTTAISFGLGVVQGINLIDTRINNGSLFTETEGNYLDLQWKGKAMISENSQGVSPGFGARMSVGRSLGKLNRWFINFKAEDIGFISWNSGTTQINSDTAVRFTGLKFNELFNTEWGTVQPSDSLRRIFTGSTITGSEMAALPWLVNASLSYSGGSNANYMAVLDARYRNLPGMKPLVGLSFYTKLFENLHTFEPLSTRLTGKLGFNMGGFGRWNTQLGINWEGKNQVIRAEFTAIEGFIAPMKLSGTGFTLNYMLKL